MRKARFPSKRNNKLMPRSEGPFKVLERVGESAYKLELPEEYGVSTTFNVGDLTPYLDDDDLGELRSIPFQEEGIDAGAYELKEESKEQSNYCLLEVAQEANYPNSIQMHETELKLHKPFESCYLADWTSNSFFSIWKLLKD